MSAENHLDKTFSFILKRMVKTVRSGPHNNETYNRLIPNFWGIYEMVFPEGSNVEALNPLEPSHWILL